MQLQPIKAIKQKFIIKNTAYQSGFIIQYQAAVLLFYSLFCNKNSIMKFSI